MALAAFPKPPLQPRLTIVFVALSRHKLWNISPTTKATHRPRRYPVGGLEERYEPDVNPTYDDLAEHWRGCDAGGYSPSEMCRIYIATVAWRALLRIGCATLPRFVDIGVIVKSAFEIMSTLEESRAYCQQRDVTSGAADISRRVEAVACSDDISVSGGLDILH